MNDNQKWLEAAAGLAQDMEYLKGALSPADRQNLQMAMTVYRQNAKNGVPWPSPDTLYCIQNLHMGSKMQLSTAVRPRL
ncbi:MAG TPA: hypothetical protein VHN74_04430 [Candidatus Angelobacter sp.]|jgi:hypothetical protein|nr:hypothetical protein [Candidatus Angelobacter sp.]